MTLPEGYTDLPEGKMANVVTCFEMRERPAPRADPPAKWILTRRERPELGWYRALFRRVGEPYLWFSRLVLDDASLVAIVHDPAVEIFSLDRDGREAGFLELDFRNAPDCELTFFGVVSDEIGTGAGRWLMNRAIECAWAKPIERFWVHTCTLDHPSAIDFYIRSGFVAYKRQVEICDDPRIAGWLPRSAAPGIPLIEKR